MVDVAEQTQADKFKERLAKDKGVWLVIYEAHDTKEIKVFRTPLRSEVIAKLEQLVGLTKNIEVYRGAKAVAVKTRVAVDLGM
jgi:ribosomal protein S19